MKIVYNVVVALVVFAGLSGCGPILLPMAPKNVAEYTERSATIKQGETTRAQVRDLLGAPMISSHLWQVDIHRFSEEALTPGTFTIFLVPVFPWAEDVYYYGYVLVTYDDNDRVRAFASRKIAQGDTLQLQADDMILTNIHRDNLIGHELVLLADGKRLTTYLKLRRKADVCMLIVGCERGTDCPEQFTIEDERAVTAIIDPRFVKKADFYKGAIPVPVMYAISLSPGGNRMAISKSNSPDKSETAFNCTPGDLRFAIIQSKVTTGGQRDFVLQVTESMPEDWSDYSIIVWRESGVSNFGE